MYCLLNQGLNYGINSIPKRLMKFIKIRKHKIVITIDIDNAHQKFNPFDKIHGIIKNIGIVGITYQNV